MTSGVRIGTPVVTTRGFRPEEMESIVQCIDWVVSDFEGNRSKVTDAVAAMVEKHPLY